MLNKKNIAVSVIIPAYNVEQYIGRCLESVITQTLHDIEILVVDDCGTDSTMDIVRSYNDSRLKIIKQKVNKGVSAARNTGIELARGKYIFFLDSDDYIEKDYLEKMYRRAIDGSFDLVISGYVKDKGNVVYHEYDHKEETIMNPVETMYEIICKKYFDWSPCDKLYLKEKLITNEVRFSERYRMGEDLDFLYRYLLSINKIVFIPLYKYHYVMNINSATHKKNTMLRTDSVAIMKGIVNNYECSALIYKRITELYAKEIGSCIKDIIMMPNTEKLVRSYQKELRKHIGIIIKNKDFSLFIKCALMFFSLPYKICYKGWKIVYKIKS